MFCLEEFWVVNDVFFKVVLGDIVVVVGVNGFGKIIMMWIILGIYKFIMGFVIYLKLLKVILIFVFNVGLCNEFIGFENIKLKGVIFGMIEVELKWKLDFIIDFFELEYVLEILVGNYFFGMRAWFFYLVVIVIELDLFIIDEVFVVGDSFFKMKCYEYLGEYV